MTNTKNGPLCAICGKGTTPRQRVVAHGRVLAHEACLVRNERKRRPIPASRYYRPPDLAECLTIWNQLADELAGILATLRTTPIAKETAETAYAAWNGVSYLPRDMVWAIADPVPQAPYAADDHCRKLRWHIERLKVAIARDGSRQGKRRPLTDFSSGDRLRLPDTPKIVCQRYAAYQSGVGRSIGGPDNFTATMQGEAP
jgi:hypothetical protein